MTEIPFLERLREHGLDRFPEADRADLERLVRSIDEAAARLRLAFPFSEEPSNVFRLAPAVPSEGKQR